VDSEHQLIESAKRGSVDAFTELVCTYRERLLRFLMTRCASFADAEDALQDTLINAYKYLHSYDPRWRFSTWLYRIAIRNAARLHAGNIAEIGDLADDARGPLEHCIDESERRNLWASARRLLSDEVYNAMWLRYVEDMSVNDIAAVLDRTASWTKVNLMRGRQALEADMNEDSSRSEAYG
jgi:RNA polymerase sigma-70 factor (ECF subfamily)